MYRVGYTPRIERCFLAVRRLTKQCPPTVPGYPRCTRSTCQARSSGTPRSPLRPLASRTGLRSPSASRRKPLARKHTLRNDNQESNLIRTGGTGGQGLQAMNAWIGHEGDMVPASTSGGTQSARSADISLICWECSPACNNARLPHFMHKGTHTLNTPPADELSPLRVGYCSRCTFFLPTLLKTRPSWSISRSLNTSRAHTPPAVHFRMSSILSSTTSG